MSGYLPVSYQEIHAFLSLDGAWLAPRLQKQFVRLVTLMDVKYRELIKDVNADPKD